MRGRLGAPAGHPRSRAPAHERRSNPRPRPLCPRRRQRFARARGRCKARGAPTKPAVSRHSGTGDRLGHVRPRGPLPEDRSAHLSLRRKPLIRARSRVWCRAAREDYEMANSFVHVELNTDNLEGAKSFYKKVFDWQLEDMPMGGDMVYTMVKPKEGTGGGMQDKNKIGMSHAATAWLPYVQVDSVKKTMGKAKKGGAQIVVEHQEVPGMGSLGIFVDPTGAPIGVWEPTMTAAAPASQRKAAAPKKAAKKATKKAAKAKAPKTKAAKKK